MSVKIPRLPKPSVARLGKTVRQPDAVPVQSGSVEDVKTKAENVCAARPERLLRLVRNSTRIDILQRSRPGLGGLPRGAWLVFPGDGRCRKGIWWTVRRCQKSRHQAFCLTSYYPSSRIGR